MNASKIRDPRFWRIWKKSGAVGDIALAKKIHKKYRICWKSLLTGFEGEGQEVLNINQARNWRDSMNEEYRGIISHWIASGSVHNFS